MNKQERLWQRLREQGLVDGALPVATGLALPWYIVLMHGIAGWLASLFLLSFLGGLLTFLNDNALLMLVLGAGLCSGSFLLLRTERGSVFFRQMGLAVSLSGQLLIALGLYEGFGVTVPAFFFSLAACQLLLAWLMPDFTHRLLSTWFALLAFFLGMEQLGLPGLASGCCVLGFVLIWLGERRLTRFYLIWLPIAYGVALALLCFASYRLTDGLAGYSQPVSAAWQVALFALHLLLFFVAVVLLALALYQRYHTAANRTVLIGWLMLGGLLLLAAAWLLPGAAVGLVLLLVGFRYGQRILVGLGGVALLGFVSWYYYHLGVSLLIKSVILLACGLLALGLLRLLQRRDQPALPKGSANRWYGYRRWVSSATLLLVLVLLAGGIYSNERQLAGGQRVLLPLAPVDPRSLMQGDYMRLRFAIAAEVAGKIEGENHDGYLVVRVDDQQVAHFVRIDQGQPLAPDELKLHYRQRNQRLLFASNAFFFQEGEAEQYQPAAYGEFAVSPAGKLLLCALRDAQLQPLGDAQFRGLW